MDGLMCRCMVLRGSTRWLWCVQHHATGTTRTRMIQQQQQLPLLLMLTFARNQNRMSRRNRDAHLTEQGRRRLMPTRIAIRGGGSQQKDDARLTHLHGCDSDAWSQSDVEGREADER